MENHFGPKHILRFWKLFSVPTAVLLTHIQVYAQPMPSATPAPDSPMRFFVAHNGGNCHDCVFIGAIGRVTNDSANEFLRFMESTSDIRRLRSPTVYLHSPGGSLIGGIQLGRQFRSLGVNTAIGHPVSLTDPNGPPWQFAAGAECLSACVFAYAGGVRRFFGPDEANGPQWVMNKSTQQTIGVHQFYRDAQESNLTTRDGPTKRDPETYDRGLSDGQRIFGLLITYLASMGVESRLLDLAARATPETVLPLTRREAYSLNLANDPALQSAWNITPTDGGLILRTRMMLNQHSLNIDIVCDTAGRNGLVARLEIDTDMRFLSTSGQTSEINDVLRKNYWGAKWYRSTASQNSDNWPATTRNYRWDGSRMNIEVTLPPAVIRHLSAGGKVQLGLDAPGFISRAFPLIQFSVPELAEAQPLLQRNCPRR
jgi:hypothetical protein